MNIYKAEVKQKYGNTEAYKEFEQKTANHTKADFAVSADGLNKILGKFAACKDNGFTPHSPQAQALAKELQDYITQNFYTCTKEFFSCLGVMYTADDRFRENIDKHSPDTAAFISKAIEIYCK